MTGDKIVALYEYAGVRIFARNVRGYLGSSTAVNDAITLTLEDEPDKFFYYNNGITVVCDKAERKERKGQSFLEVSNPQIINGQQTTRALASNPARAAKVSVLVKVIEVARGPNGKLEAFDDLISRIVAGTNSQNSITQADLMSNDRIQIDIERGLRRRGYVYLRKRQTRGEAIRHLGGKGKILISKEQLAQAAAGCEMDPHLVRSGKEHLFDEGNYKLVFPNSDPDYYLPRYYCLRSVSELSRGVAARSYAKWMVLNSIWSDIGYMLGTKRIAKAFIDACEWDDERVLTPLSSAVNRTFVAASKFYRMARGKGAEALDPSQFYRNRKGRHKEFSAFWRTPGAANDRKRLRATLARVKDALKLVAQ